MTQFQKLAIGPLGLTHPEIFTLRQKAGQKPSAKIIVAHHSAEPVRPEPGKIARIIRAFRFVIAALAMGSRTVALADNGEVRRDLGAYARLLYGSNADTDARR